MRIKVEQYSEVWKENFDRLKAELQMIVGFADPHIEHIGSTAIEGLAAKPIIDILVGVKDAALLDETVKPLVEQGYSYYKVFNDLMPYRRFFIRHKEGTHNAGSNTVINEEIDIPRTTKEHDQRLAHIHIVTFNTEHWIRHIAFRDYLRQHPDVKKEYAQLKEALHKQEWVDGNDYNKAKDPFIKREEQKAIAWYTKSVIGQ